MPNSLISDVELLWVVRAVAPARTRVIADPLPIDQNSAYLRLRSLAKREYLTYINHNNSDYYEWELGTYGERRVKNAREDAEIPSASETDFDAYFAGRELKRVHPRQLLTILSADPDMWHPSTTFYEELPYARVTIRDVLHELVDIGAIELDDSEQTYRWRVTDRGSDALAAFADPEREPPEWALIT